MGKRHVQFNLSARSSADANLDVFAVAAMRIQSMFRGWYARDCIAIDNYCATIIQNAYRSHSAEKRYQLDRNYIIRAQAWARRKRAFDVFATCMYCVVAIQAAFRAYQVRKSIRQRFQEPPSFIQHVAATVIQAQWRCFRCEMAFLRAYEDILLVQSVARGWVTRRLIKSWLRARNIKTFYICKETPRKAKGTPVYSYNLPHGYHNHTAFLRNNIPSPLRSPTSGKMLKEEGDAIVVNSTVSDPGSYQHKSKMTKDGLLEKYRKKRDKAMIDETRDARRETDIVDGKTGATNGKLSNGLQGCKRLGDTLRPKADCTSDQKNKHLFTRERLIAQANASDNCPRKANSDTGVTSHQEIRQGNQRTKADWRAKSQLIMKFGNANDSPQSEIPKNSQGTSNFQRKLTLSLSHDETVKRNKTNGLHDLVEGIREGGTSFASSRFSRSRLPQSASFDPTWTNQSTAVIASEVVSAAAAKPHIDSSHSSASLVLASWRNREKQGGAQDRNIIADVSNGRTDDVALENENKTTWCSNQKRDEASRGGTMPETISQGPTSWQHGRAGLSLSKSCDETRDHSQPCAKQGEEKPRSLNNNSLYQRTLRPVNQDKQDEKKDDVVRTASNKVITEDASWKQHNPKEAGLILHKSKRMDTLGSLKVPGVAVTSQNIKESHPVKLVREQSNQSAETFKPIQSKSPIHVELRKKRSESEQQRIDSMHLIFIRSGLIGRHEKEKISFANTTSAEYEGKIRDADDDFEPTASDILNAWKGCDQTQPTMIGNLF